MVRWLGFGGFNFVEAFGFQAALMIAANGRYSEGCRGLPLLVVGGETPARANDYTTGSLKWTFFVFRLPLGINHAFRLPERKRAL